MHSQEISSELRSIADEILRPRGLVLVDVICRREGRDLFLRILADRPEGGITLEECAQVNRDISGVLDERGPLEARYILEVSSPGLDRALKTKEDFSRCVSRRVRFFLSQSLDGKVELEGRITKIENEAVSLESDDATIEIPLAIINRAKQIV